eukprot:631642-Pelagomonas_calceolata.AAC.11
MGIRRITSSSPCLILVTRVERSLIKSASAPRNTAAIPCRHMSMCDGCAGALKAQSSKCPVCRTEIDSFLHIKLKQKQEAS